ncbi:hypothetical protein MKY59_07435 [Paenibacillus sp. FSL W8-0426]|uniref:hypothetical protein n=1 Tax=Paenibacillus sp. FSL W8-0426 TaxID=2921714 RepID=UPI0030DA1055
MNQKTADELAGFLLELSIALYLGWVVDLENIMHNFKNENPDGPAPSEVFPLAISLKNNTNTWMGSLDWPAPDLLKNVPGSKIKA